MHNFKIRYLVKILNINFRKPYVAIGILAMALKTVTTYPILLFCGREALRAAISDIQSLLRPTGNGTVTQSQEEPQDNIKQRVIVVLVWFALSLLW